MIVSEDILKEIFAQLPEIKGFKPKFNWGNEKVLDLYLSQIKKSNKYPLVWLVEDNEQVNISAHSLERNVKLIIAKETAHRDNTNPIIWETEFSEVLNPMLKNVITALEKSGVTTIKDEKYTISKRTNYTENGSETKAIDNWNVIVFEARVIFKEKADGTALCINQIRF